MNLSLCVFRIQLLLFGMDDIKKYYFRKFIELIYFMKKRKKEKEKNFIFMLAQVKLRVGSRDRKKIRNYIYLS